MRTGQRAALGDVPCHGDIFHIQQLCEGLANRLGRMAQGPYHPTAKGRTKQGTGQAGKAGKRPCRWHWRRHATTRPSSGASPRRQQSFVRIGQSFGFSDFALSTPASKLNGFGIFGLEDILRLHAGFERVVLKPGVQPLLKRDHGIPGDFNALVRPDRVDRKTVSKFSWLASFRQCSSSPVVRFRPVAHRL